MPVIGVAPDQVLMGVGVASLCLMGLRYEEVLLTESQRLQWLRQKCGDVLATWVVRIGLLFGVTFGSLLAAGVIRPMHTTEVASDQRPAVAAGGVSL